MGLFEFFFEGDNVFEFYFSAVSTIGIFLGLALLVGWLVHFFPSLEIYRSYILLGLYLLLVGVSLDFPFGSELFKKSFLFFSFLIFVVSVFSFFVL